MRSCQVPDPTASPSGDTPSDRNRILIVEDEAPFRRYLTTVLKSQYEVREAPDGESALNRIAESPPDLVVMDVHLPGLSGAELLSEIHAVLPHQERVKVLLMSGAMPPNDLANLTDHGADDFLAKPFGQAELLSRIHSLLPRNAHVPDTSQTQTVRIATVALTRSVSEPPALVDPTHSAALLAGEVLAVTISRLMMDSNLVSDGHWQRVVQYVRALAEAAPVEGEYVRLKDAHFVDLLCAVAPLYDVGQLAVPRNLLMKPDRLNPDERNLLQTHTTQGAEVLKSVAGHFPGMRASLSLAEEITRSHHERWDGFGYPDRLRGEAIPLAARVVAIIAVYEAMRSRRPHRPPLSHARTMRIITSECASQFDPKLLEAFRTASARFDQIHQET